MAIITEQFFIGEKEFIKTCSNENRYVVRDSVEYIEACDPAEYERVYTEGDVIPTPDPDPDIDDSEALEILLGGES